MVNSFKYINNKIKNSESILLSTHENPDCDGLGSEIALYYYIKSLGKDCKIINSTAMSDKYKFIDPENIIEVYNSTQDKWLKNIDLAILFTFMDMRRLQGDVAYNIVIFDELLDSSLDEKGVELVLSLLNERVETYKENIYIISHRKESAKASTGEVITLQKQNGITTRVDFIDEQQ